MGEDWGPPPSLMPCSQSLIRVVAHEVEESAEARLVLLQRVFDVGEACVGGLLPLAARSGVVVKGASQLLLLNVEAPHLIGELLDPSAIV